jgi:deoxyribose-phosphate aldolase
VLLNGEDILSRTPKEMRDIRGRKISMILQDPQTSLSMVRMIRWFHEETGIEIGYKPAGGIAAAKTALDYMALMKEELGTHWLEPHLFRFGASSLLTDIERQLEHGLTGHYAADYRMPMV